MKARNIFHTAIIVFNGQRLRIATNIGTLLSSSTGAGRTVNASCPRSNGVAGDIGEIGILNQIISIAEISSLRCSVKVYECSVECIVDRLRSGVASGDLGLLHVAEHSRNEDSSQNADDSDNYYKLNQGKTLL
jgi:hypothetical protein